MSFLHADGAGRHAEAADADRVLRFHVSERLIHWAVALPFMVCWLSGAVLVLAYNPDPERAHRMVFGWAHRLSGLGLLTLPLWTLIRHGSDLGLHLRNIGEAWRWSVDDVKWIVLKGPAAVNRRIRLPHQGKFNAGEKINFMILTATYPLYVITGVLIWTHQFAFAAWLVHLTLAAIATPLIVGHVYLAMLNPDTRPGLTGMTSGFVDRRWAAHHYTRWYHEHHAGSAAAAESTPVEAPSRIADGPARLDPDFAMVTEVADADPVATAS